MKIAVVGGTGLTGSRIVPEAASRDHHVTAISRHPEQAAARPNVTPVKGDVFDVDGLAAVLSGHDVVIYAYSPRNDHQTNRTGPHREATFAVIAATRKAGVPRLLAVGGAGTLEASPGVKLMDSPEFPPEYMESAISTAEVLKILKLEPTEGLDWSYISPAAFFDMTGGRKGVYRVGGDVMLRDEAGKCEISLEDLAVAIVDEAEAWKHSRSRFSVAY